MNINEEIEWWTKQTFRQVDGKMIDIEFAQYWLLWCAVAMLGAFNAILGAKVERLYLRVETLEQDQLFNMKISGEHSARLQDLENAYGAHVHERGDGKNNTVTKIW